MATDLTLVAGAEPAGSESSAASMRTRSKSLSDTVSMVTSCCGRAGAELQMLLGEALDALGPVEQAPFGAQHGDGIPLRLDLLAQAPDILIESAGLVFALVDDISERDERQHQADIDETQHGLNPSPPKACRQAGSAMRGTPKLARSRACGGASVRSPALRRAERARGFSLISSFDGDNGRRLRSRKLGTKI